MKGVKRVFKNWYLVNPKKLDTYERDAPAYCLFPINRSKRNHLFQKRFIKKAIQIKLVETYISEDIVYRIRIPVIKLVRDHYNWDLRKSKDEVDKVMTKMGLIENIKGEIMKR